MVLIIQSISGGFSRLTAHSNNLDIEHLFDFSAFILKHARFEVETK